MGKVSELSQLIEELNRCGNTLIGISEDLKNLFSGRKKQKKQSRRLLKKHLRRHLRKKKLFPWKM